MPIEQWQALGHGSQFCLHALWPALALLPFYILGRVAAARDPANTATRRWRAVRGTEYLLFCVFGIGLLGLTLGEIPCSIVHGRSQTCLSNVKHLGLAVLMYAQDWDERCAPADRWGTLALSRPIDQLTRDTFKCPCSPSPFGYALNRAMGGADMAQVTEVIDTVLLFEADATTVDANGGPESLCAAPRHSGRRYYGYADGHVENYNRESHRPPRWDTVAPAATKGNR